MTVCLRHQMALQAVPVLLGLLLLSGCTTENYPDDLKYPPRSDPVVIGRPEQDAPGIDKPGEFPDVLFAYLEPEEHDRLLRSPSRLTAEQRQPLEKALENLFGTPAHPKLEGEAFDGLRASLKPLDEDTLAQGSSLYRKHCLHCHGLTGDGRGSTAPWINPHPRDYRQGIFKFTSSNQKDSERKPRRDDLLRTIREGIEGTSMPSFGLLADDEIEALASYVIHLSIRGQTEFWVMSAIFGAEGFELRGEGPDAIAEGVNDYLGLIVRHWKDAQAAESRILKPEDTMPSYQFGSPEHKESARRGHTLFIQQGDAGCISCHIDFGRQSAYKYDAWGTIVRPADLTAGIYRGGRRPVDLYYRVHSGVNGSGMTAFKDLPSKEIWDLVSFLQVLPYPQMRKQYGIKLESE